MSKQTDRLSDEQRAERVARAHVLFAEDLPGQDTWYERRARQYKRRADVFAFTVILAGALVAVLPALERAVPAFDAIYLTSALGLVVILAQGALRVWRFDELWLPYRKARELIKRERALYVNAAGAYSEAEDEEVRFRLFVERIERIIADEQQVFFDMKSKAEHAARSRRSEAAALLDKGDQR